MNSQEELIAKYEKLIIRLVEDIDHYMFNEFSSGFQWDDHEEMELIDSIFERLKPKG